MAQFFRSKKRAASRITFPKDGTFSPYLANVSFVGSEALAEEFAQLEASYGDSVMNGDGSYLEIQVRTVPIGQFPGAEDVIIRYDAHHPAS